MAVERSPQFVLDLGSVIQARLRALAEQRRIIRAREEAEFQRRILEEGLSLEDQLAYRNQQLEREKRRRFPDQDFISALKTEIATLRKMIRQRKFRQKYYDFLQMAAAGRKSISDEIEFLQEELVNAIDDETRDEIRERIIDLTRRKLAIDQAVEDQKIQFYTKDRTLQSYDKAIELVKKQLSKIEVMKNPEVATAYQLKLQALQQEKASIAVEEKINDLLIDMSKASDYAYPSLMKLNKLNSLLSTADENTPVTINGVRYNSEREFWQATLDKFINTEFADAFNREVNKNLSLVKTQRGQVPDGFIEDITRRLRNLKSNPALTPYRDVITSLSQEVSSTILSEKIDDVKKEFNLGTSLATRFDVWKAKNRIRAYQKYFPDISLDPILKQFDEMAAEKQLQLSKEVLSAAVTYREQHPEATWEEAIKKVTPLVGAITPKEELFKPKTAEELGKGLVEKAKAPEKLLKEEQKQKEEIIEEEKRLEKELAGEKVEEPKMVKPPKEEEFTVHKVQAGETLWSIAKKYLGSGRRWKELLKPEGTPFTAAEARRLRVGQEIKIPKIKQ